MRTLVLAWLTAIVTAADSIPFDIPADPFADPRNDRLNPLRYIPSNVLTGIAFALVLLVAATQSVLTWKYGAKFMLAMVIGGYTFALGIATRFGLANDPRNSTIYIVQYLFVVLSPCAYIAATYVLLGRLSRHIKCNECLLVPPHRITLIFVMSDVITFLVQASGGAMSASASKTRNLKLRDRGSRLFLIGLALQLASFAVYTCIYLIFLYRVYTKRKEVWASDAGKKWYNDWRALAVALIISCVGILIRSVFRTVELSEGFGGHLATHEVYFYTLDTLPLFLATAIFVPFWPGRFITPVMEDNEEDRNSTGTVRVEPVEKDKEETTS